MNIDSIIYEELYKLLKESDYQDNDIIDPTKISLTDEYSKLNGDLFGNTLPRISMRWSNRKGNLGHVKALFNRLTREAKIEYLAISSFHAMPYRIFKDTLAHEMIHIKLLTYGGHDRRDPHDYNFMKEANRINGMGLGYNITKSSEEKLGISNTVSNNKLLVGIMLNIDGTNYLSVTTPNVFKAEGELILKSFKNSVERGRYKRVEITVVESKNVQMLKYRIGRTFRRGFSYAPLSDELLNELLQDKILLKLEFELGGEHKISETENPNAAGNWEEIIIV